MTTVAQRRSMPRRARAASSASISTKPSVAWVWAPHQSSGTGGTTAAASSFFTSRLPTWGPLPCVITTSWPSAIRSATDSIATSRGLDLVLGPGAPVRVGHGVSAEREQDPHGTNLETPAGRGTSNIDQRPGIALATLAQLT